MLSNLGRRFGLPASFTGAAIGIVAGVYEVQGWKMPGPLAVALITALLIMIVVAISVMGYEAIKEVLLFLERRATSAAWVSQEEPGLLDYEADFLRASDRFKREMVGLANDTGKLGRDLGKHTKRLEEPKVRRLPFVKQNRANQAAKSIDRSAIYIEKRAELLNALVKDVSRNLAGWIATAAIATPEDKTAAEELMESLGNNVNTATATIEKTTGYRDTVRSMEKQNPARTVRIASKRLADGLDSTVKILRRFKEKSRELHDQLSRRISASQ